jgi:hypothetical protein
MAQGSCLCGAVQYDVSGPFNMMLHCHCSMCRKHHGTAFATFVAAPLESFKWISGEADVVRYQSSEKGHRPFCRICGSVAPTLAPEMGLVIIPAGNLDGDLGVQPELHMFVGSKAPWTSITDSLPQHEAWPPGFGGDVIDRPAPEMKPDVATGSCLCGDVTYEYTGTPVRMWSCHCTRCRRARSAAHGTNVFTTTEQFRWTQGEELVASYKVPDARFFTVSFCTRCGSSVPHVATARGFSIVPLGSLDSDPGMRTIAHVFTGSKAPWFEITESTPQYVETPPMPSSPPRAT